MIEIGPNLYHTAILFILIWGVVRFFAVLGQVAVAGQVKRRVKSEPINFTK